MLLLLRVFTRSTKRSVQAARDAPRRDIGRRFGKIFLSATTFRRTKFQTNSVHDHVEPTLHAALLLPSNILVSQRKRGEHNVNPDSVQRGDALRCRAQLLHIGQRTAEKKSRREPTPSLSDSKRLRPVLTSKLVGQKNPEQKHKKTNRVNNRRSPFRLASPAVRSPQLAVAVVESA